MKPLAVLSQYSWLRQRLAAPISCMPVISGEETLSYRTRLVERYSASIHRQRIEITYGAIRDRGAITKQFLAWLHYGLRFEKPTVDLMEYIDEVPSLLEKRAMPGKSMRDSLMIYIEEDFAGFIGSHVEQAFERQHNEPCV